MSDRSSLQFKRQQERLRRIRAQTAQQLDTSSLSSGPGLESPSHQPPLFRERRGPPVGAARSISSVSDGREFAGGLQEGELSSLDNKLDTLDTKLAGLLVSAPSAPGRMVELKREEICGGKVRMRIDGSAYDGMCIKSADSCTVKSHVTTKCEGAFPWDSSRSWFIQPTGKDSVFPHPSLKSVEVDMDETVKEVLSNLGRAPIQDLMSQVETLQQTIDGGLGFSDEEGDEFASNISAGTAAIKAELDRELAPSTPVKKLPDDSMDGKTASTIEAILNTLQKQRDFVNDVNELAKQDRLDMDRFKKKFGEATELVNNMSSVLGDIEWLADTYGSVASALYHVSTTTSETAEKLNKFLDSMTMNDQDIEDLVIAANNEVVRKVNELATSLPVSPPNASLSTQAQPSADPMSAVLDGDGRLHSGLTISPVDGVPLPLQDLVRKVLYLEQEVTALKSAVDAKGGRRVGPFYWASRDDLLVLVQAENPSGKALAAFIDAVLLFNHTKPMTPKEKLELQKLNPYLSNLDVSILEHCDCSSAICPPYTGSSQTPYKPGSRLPAFESADIFYGVSASAGQGTKAKIEEAAEQSGQKVESYAKQHLKNAPTLSALSATLAARSVAFHRAFLTHCDSEKTVLKALNLSMDDILLLFSEFTQLIFEYLHKEYLPIHGMNDEDCDPVERFTTYLWAILGVHEKMEEFTKGGFAHHSRMQSAFVRFLTRKTGENAAAGVGAKFLKLEKEVKAAADKSLEAKREALAAKNLAKGASDGVDNIVKKNELKK